MVRELLLALGLVGGSALVVRGVALVSTPAAWILAGVVVVAMTWLFLTEAD